MKTRNSAWPMAAVVLLLPAARSQQIPAAPARPQFEVASLKPNNGCENTPRSPAPFMASISIRPTGRSSFA